MAIQIIPEQGVGESLGAGLGAGLQGLAQLKTQDLMRRQQAQYNVPLLQGLFPGVGNQQLQQLAMSDPSLINQLLRRQYETQQGAQLAGIIKDPRLAGLNPSQISAYMSSPEYAKARAMKEASGTIGDIKKSIEGGVSGGKFSGFVSGLMGGKKSSYDALVSQLGTSNDPLIKSLAAGLGAAPDDKTRRTIFNTFVKNNPDSMPQVGQAIDNLHNQYTDSEGSQQPAMGNDQQQQQGDGLIQEPEDRTAGQIATGIGAELVKSPVNLADTYTALTDKAEKTIEPVLKKLGIDKVAENESSFVSAAKNFGKDDPNNTFMNQVYKDIQNKLGISSDGKEDFKGLVNNIAEKISPGSTSKENLGLLESAARTTASSAPLLALFSPFTAAGLATTAAVDLAGNVAGETLKEMGVGGTGQFVGNLATSMLARKGFGSLANYFNKVKSPGSTVEQLKNQLYKDAENLGNTPNIETGVGKNLKLNVRIGTSRGKPIFATSSPVDPNSIHGKLDQFIKDVEDAKIGNSFSKVERDALIANAENTQRILSKKLVSPNKLAEELKSINDNWVDNKSLNSRFYKQYRGIIADKVAEAGANNKAWYDVYKPAQELHSIQNWKSGLTKGIESFFGAQKYSNIKTSPFMAFTLPFMSKTRAATMVGASLIPSFIDKAGRAVKIFEFVQKSPQGRELLSRLVEAGAKRNDLLAGKTLMSLNKFYNKYDKILKTIVDKKINL